MCFGVISWDIYLWLDMWVLVYFILPFSACSQLYFSSSSPLPPPIALLKWFLSAKLMGDSTISLFYTFLWKIVIYLVVVLDSFPSLAPGQIPGLQVLKEWEASSPWHTQFGEALGSSAWRTHLFPQVLCQIFWEPYLFTITSFTTPRNTSLVHYTILVGFFPSVKEIWLSTSQQGLGRGNLRAGRDGPLPEKEGSQSSWIF